MVEEAVDMLVTRGPSGASEGDGREDMLKALECDG